MKPSTESRILLLTGAPGVGKTTVLCKVASALKNCAIGGFFTEEIREGGERTGFRLNGFDGTEGVIAHIAFPHRHRIGKYGVDVDAIDRLSEATLVPRPETDIHLVDEIGKMECLSPGFVTRMTVLLNGPAPVIATIAQKAGGFIEAVKQREDAVSWEVTRENRNRIPERVVAWARERIGSE